MTESKLNVLRELISSYGSSVPPSRVKRIASSLLALEISSEDAGAISEEHNLALREREDAGVALPPPSSGRRPIPAPGASRRSGKTMEALRQRINAVSRELEEYPVRPVEYAEDGVTPVLLLSDLHIGEVVDEDGQRIYDTEIAKESIADIVTQFLQSPELAGSPVDSCVVVLAGDLLDGEHIFPSQMVEGTDPVHRQFDEAVNFFYRQLIRIAEHAPSLTVACVPGNHGRTARFNDPMTNYENLMYKTLRLMFSVAAEDGNVAAKNTTVLTPDQMWLNFEVRGHRLHARHIGVKNVSSAGGAKKTYSWVNKHQADLIMFGHFHQPEILTLGEVPVIKNGSTVPGNDFSEKHGFASCVGQWMFAVSNESPLVFAKLLTPRK